MTAIFAEMTSQYSAPAELLSWLECASYCMGLVALFAIAKAFLFPKKEKGLPQPLEVRSAKRMATHEELEAARREWRARQEEYERRAEQFRRETKIELREIDEHIRSIPHQVIAVLRDTKGLIP